MKNKFITRVFGLSLILRCGWADIIFLKNLDFPVNGAPNFELPRYEDRVDKNFKNDPIFMYTGDDAVYKLKDKNAAIPKAEEQYSKVGNQITNRKKFTKLYKRINEEAKNIKIIVLQPEDLNEIPQSDHKLNSLNFYKAPTEVKIGDAEAQNEIDEIKAGAVLVGILSSFRRNLNDTDRGVGNPRELGFNIYVPISYDIVNPPFLPRESLEKIVYKSGLPLIDLGNDIGVRFTN